MPTNISDCQLRGYTVGTTGVDKNEPFWFTVN